MLGGKVPVGKQAQLVAELLKYHLNAFLIYFIMLFHLKVNRCLSLKVIQLKQAKPTKRGTLFELIIVPASAPIRRNTANNPEMFLEFIFSLIWV